MTDYNRIDSYLEQNLDQSLAELSRLVAHHGAAVTHGTMAFKIFDEA